jgi:hypothetical protein
LWIDKRQFPTDADFAAFNALTLLPFQFFNPGNGFVFAACTNSAEAPGTDDPNFGYAQVKFKPEVPQLIWSQITPDNQTTPAAPWGFINGGGDQLDDYPEFTFAELAVNATLLLGFDSTGSAACDNGLASIFVKTRSSASFSASLKDGAGPYSLTRNPDILVTLADADYECYETSATLTADVTSEAVIDTYTWYKWIGDAWVQVAEMLTLTILMMRMKVNIM